MELIVFLGGLYIAQCIVHLSPAAAIFRKRREGWFWRRGERLVLSSIWPGRVDIVTERILPTEWMGDISGSREGREDVVDQQVAVRNRRVVVGSRALFRLSTPGGAAQLCSLFEEVEARPEKKSIITGAFIIRALSPDYVQQRLDQAFARSRILGMYATLYMILLFVLLPALILLFGEVIAFLLALPVLAVVHAAFTYEFWRVHRDLALPRNERATEVLMGFLYPPALLRARHDVVQAAVAVLHPAAVAAVLTTNSSLRVFLAGELALLEGHAERGATALLKTEEDQLMDIITHSGLSKADLEQSRARRDAAALAYCPRCESDYARAVEQCCDCGSRIVAYEDLLQATNPAVPIRGTRT